MEDPQKILRDIEPGNDRETRTIRQNQLNAVKAQIDRWLEAFSDRPQGGPYRNEMQAAVDQLIEELERIRPD